MNGCDINDSAVPRCFLFTAVVLFEKKNLKK